MTAQPLSMIKGMRKNTEGSPPLQRLLAAPGMGDWSLGVRSPVVPNMGTIL
jgi:hypothetical protein